MEIVIENSVVYKDVWLLKIGRENSNIVDVTLQLTEDDVINLFRACAKTEIGIDMLKNYKN